VKLRTDCACLGAREGSCLRTARVVIPKNFCQTGGRGGRKKNVLEKRGAKKLRESSKSEEESNASGKEWMRNFSTIKVSHPRHTKHVAELR